MGHWDNGFAIFGDLKNLKHRGRDYCYGRLKIRDVENCRTIEA